MEKVFVQGVGPVFLGSFSSRGQVDLPEGRDLYAEREDRNVVADITPDDDVAPFGLKVEVCKEKKVESGSGVRTKGTKHNKFGDSRIR
jgi:hypothetical protein